MTCSGCEYNEDEKCTYSTDDMDAVVDMSCIELFDRDMDNLIDDNIMGECSCLACLFITIISLISHLSRCLCVCVWGGGGCII